MNPPRPKMKKIVKKRCVKQGIKTKDDNKYQEVDSRECKQDPIKLSDLKAHSHPHALALFYNKFQLGKELFYKVNQTVNSKVTFCTADPVLLEIDAIVCELDESFKPINPKIFSAGGIELKKEAEKQFSKKIFVTPSYNLPCKYVIFTVCPEVEDEDSLVNIYLNCLQLVEQHGIQSVAFPCIGVHQLSSQKAAMISLKTVRAWLSRKHDIVKRLIFCLYEQKDIDAYQKLLFQYFPVPENTGCFM